jgi:zinc/manganese transport system permease protein
MLSLQASQAVIATLAGIVVSAVLVAICRPLLFLSVDPDVAVSRGVPVRLVTLLFLVLVGATVAEAVQAVGALLIFALMVTPAAIAQNLTARPYAGMALAAALGVVFVWAGLALAFYIPYPVSFFITALAFAAYLASVAYGRLWAGRAARFRAGIA